jgi:hypothetical protein
MVNIKPQNSGEIVDMRDKNGRFVSGHEKIGGKKEGSISLTTKIKRELETVPQGEKDTYGDLIAKKVVEMAAAGEPTIIKMLWSQIDGTPRVHLDLSNERRPIPLLEGVKEYILKEGSTKD